jgi:hypothetical protein
MGAGNSNDRRQKAAAIVAETLDFLSGPGEMAFRMRDHDWANTVLGPPATWSMPLKTLVGLMLSSVQPMFSRQPIHMAIYRGFSLHFV